MPPATEPLPKQGDIVPGIWTGFLNGLSPEEAVVAFAEKGWLHLEMSSESGMALLKRGDPEAVGEAFRRHAADAGVNFPQGHLWLLYDITLHSPEKVLEDLKPWLDLFLAVGIRAAVLHPGGQALLRGGCAPTLVAEKRNASLRALGEHLRGTDLFICLENMQEAPLAHDLVEIVESSGAPNLGVCLDTGHLHLTGTSQADFIRASGDKLRALHIADNEGDFDAHLFPFGRGTVDWAEVVSALREAGCSALFNFEVPGENRCPLPVRMKKLDYYRSVLPMLLDPKKDAAPGS